MEIVFTHSNINNYLCTLAHFWGGKKRKHFEKKFLKNALRKNHLPLHLNLKWPRLLNNAAFEKMLWNISLRKPVLLGATQEKANHRKELPT